MPSGVRISISVSINLPPERAGRILELWMSEPSVYEAYSAHLTRRFRRMLAPSRGGFPSQRATQFFFLAVRRICPVSQLHSAQPNDGSTPYHHRYHRVPPLAIDTAELERFYCIRDL